MKEIGSISLMNMNNAAHFLFVSNMADRTEKDSAVAEKCAAQVKSLREAVTAEDENRRERTGVTEDICIDIEPSRGFMELLKKA